MTENIMQSKFSYKLFRHKSLIFGCYKKRHDCHHNHGLHKLKRKIITFLIFWLWPVKCGSSQIKKNPQIDPPLSNLSLTNFSLFFSFLPTKSHQTSIRIEVNRQRKLMKLHWNFAHGLKRLVLNHQLNWKPKFTSHIKIHSFCLKFQPTIIIKSKKTERDYTRRELETPRVFR